MKRLSPLKAIRAKCLDCCAGNAAEVKRCHIEDCSLWQFRFGHNPNRAGIGNKDAFLSSGTSRESKETEIKSEGVATDG